MTVEVALAYDYVAGSDTLRDQDDLRWTRADRAEGLATPPPAQQPPATQMPLPEPTPAATPESTAFACIDLADGGTYTAPAGTYTALPGPVSLTATVPEAPAIPWQGEPDVFYLSAGCGSFSPISVLASIGSDVPATSCMPPSLEITSFADAVARLDTPKGDDISDRVDLTIGGHPAARYDIADLSSCLGGFGLWGGTILGAGETGSIYVIDVDGTLLGIELNRNGNQTPAELEEAWAIVESLQITR